MFKDDVKKMRTCKLVVFAQELRQRSFPGACKTCRVVRNTVNVALQSLQYCEGKDKFLVNRPTEDVQLLRIGLGRRHG